MAISTLSEIYSAAPSEERGVISPARSPIHESGEWRSSLIPILLILFSAQKE
jgi:hypothetical protein